MSTLVYGHLDTTYIKNGITLADGFVTYRQRVVGSVTVFKDGVHHKAELRVKELTQVFDIDDTLDHVDRILDTALQFATAKLGSKLAKS